ncbi:hypothetical protein [Sphingomonas crusticola]|uniref:hypothetical protein n=1 Tax=Sphingomonas crusticola TaxID=1697973 RepID=UPI000E2505F1|nr:hypothetical protein [Sphingomonas crusticola]
MAEKLGMPPSSYSRYEDANDFKRPYLPVDLARKVAAVLADHAVDPSAVMELAGLAGDADALPVITAGEQELLDQFRTLDAARRQLVLQLITALGGNAPHSVTLHEGPMNFRPRQDGDRA